MEKGKSNITTKIEKQFDEGILQQIEQLEKDYLTFKTIRPTFEKELDFFLKKLSQKDALYIRNYTGDNCKKINGILRNKWDGEKQTIKDKQRIKKNIDIMDKMIKNFPSISDAFVTYRGTTIEEFKKYNINDLEELKYLEGNYLFEEGYTSTSLDQENSYYQKEVLGVIANIETTYLIPPNTQEGMPLLSEKLSYSTNQQEYVLQRNTLSKVLQVEINKETAKITALVIPKKIWNKTDINIEI